MKRSSLQRGVSVIEVLIGVGIFALVTVFVTHSISLFLESADRSQHSLRALYLAEEGHEALRYLRDENWDTIDNLSVDTTYYLSMSAASVATTTTPEVINGYYNRSFVLREVYRDSDDDIVASTTVGASLDTGSRFVVMRVGWGSEEVSLQTLLTNIFNR